MPKVGFSGFWTRDRRYSGLHTNGLPNSLSATKNTTLWPCYTVTMRQPSIPKVSELDGTCLLRLPKPDISDGDGIDWQASVDKSELLKRYDDFHPYLQAIMK